MNETKQKLLHDKLKGGKRDNSQNPLISVITVVYNGEDHLQETIDSIMDQQYSNYEYIIIDGGSKDGTLDILKKNEEYINLWLSEPDEGIYEAMNKGISLAKGKIIGIINSDDYYSKDTLNHISDLYKNNIRQFDKFIICGAISRVDVFGNHLYQIKKNTNMNFFKSNYKKRMPVNHPATFITKGVYDELGGYKKNLKYSADYEMILRCYVNKVNIFFTEKVLSIMREGGVSYSINNLYKRAVENYHIRRSHGIPNNLYISIEWFLTTILKHIIRKILLLSKTEKLEKKYYEKK